MACSVAAEPWALGRRGRSGAWAPPWALGGGWRPSGCRPSRVLPSPVSGPWRPDWRLQECSVWGLVRLQLAEGPGLWDRRPAAPAPGSPGLQGEGPAVTRATGLREAQHAGRPLRVGVPPRAPARRPTEPLLCLPRKAGLCRFPPLGSSVGRVSPGAALPPVTGAPAGCRPAASERPYLLPRWHLTRAGHVLRPRATVRQGGPPRCAAPWPRCGPKQRPVP